MNLTPLLIGTGLLCLVHVQSHAASLEVPDDYKAHVNQVEFLAHIAQRCDIQISVYGKKGISDPVCRDFLAKVPSTLGVEPTTQDRWIKLGRLVDQSTNRAIHVEWNTFHARLNRDLDTCQKTLDHMKFFR